MPDPQERLRELLEDYVDRRLADTPCTPADLCHDEPELLPALLRLVAELEMVDEALGAGSCWAEMARPELEDDVPPAIADYRLLRKLGAGGMGEVWEALQEAPLRRRVAIKVIRPGFSGSEVLARFAAERQALAMMSHPNIARVFDAGTTTNGRPYFAMERVHGSPVTAFCDDHALPVGERLDLFVGICDAVQHAHQRGIIHRDLKPSNILVNDDGVPKVIDFGIAKAVGEKLAGGGAVTQLGQFLGTPEYMSPEQADPHQLDVDVRSDVYSLGVILYEILVGERPWKAAGADAGVTEASSESRRGSAPRTPSERLRELGRESSEVASRRRTSAPNLVRALRGELDWITVRALEPDRERRYSSAAELAEDLERHRRHEPVRAGPPSRAYRLRKFARRHRVGVLVTALVSLAVLGTGGGLALGLARALRAERLATREAATAQQVSQFVVDLFEVTDPGAGRGDELSARKLLEEGRRRLEQELVDQPLVRARLLQTIADIHRKLGLFDEAESLFEESLEIRRRLLGDGHLEVARSLMGLARLEAETGELQQAEHRLRGALGIFEAGADPTELGRALHALASITRQIGRYPEAASLELRSLALLEQELGPRHPDLAPGLDNLGSIHVRTGRLEKAEEVYRRALAIDEGISATERLGSAQTLGNLAIVLRRRGRHEEAEPLLRRALSLQQRVLGNDHPGVASVLQNLATVLVRKGRFAEARELFEQSLDIQTRSVGRDHPDSTAVLKNLGLTSLLEGNLEAAEELLQEAVEIDTSKQGAEHLATIWGRVTLGDVAVEAGRYDVAERRYRDALDRAEASLDAAHPLRVRGLRGLGRVAAAEQRYEEAEALHRKALALQESLLSADDPAVAGTLNHLGEVLVAQGRSEEARQHLTRALAFQEQSFGPQHWELAPTLVRLGGALLASDEAAAEEHLRRGLGITEATFGADHLQAANAHHGLARVFAQRGDWTAAATHYDRAHAIRLGRLGPDHPLTRETRRELSTLPKRVTDPGAASQ